MTTTTPRCKWDRDTSTYLRPDGHPCKTDDYGDPTHHCTNRRCTNHIAANEQTCARCVGRARMYIKGIRDKSKLMLTAALAGGVNSEAANLAGPAANYETFSARRRIDREWIYTHIPEQHMLRAMRGLLADDDEDHPFSVLGRWDFMLRVHYGHPAEDVVTIDNAADYLDRTLARLAQDEDQDFPQLYRELKKCAQHLDTVLQNSQRKDRGAPCPDCANDHREEAEEAEAEGREVKKKPLPRLLREYGHWCTEDDCTKLHYMDDAGDQWVCPRQPAAHVWSHEAYTNWIEEREAS